MIKRSVCLACSCKLCLDSEGKKKELVKRLVDLKMAEHEVSYSIYGARFTTAFRPSPPPISRILCISPHSTISPAASCWSSTGRCGGLRGDARSKQFLLNISMKRSSACSTASPSSNSFVAWSLSSPCASPDGLASPFESCSSPSRSSFS